MCSSTSTNIWPDGPIHDSQQLTQPSSHQSSTMCHRLARQLQQHHTADTPCPPVCLRRGLPDAVGHHAKHVKAGQRQLGLVHHQQRRRQARGVLHGAHRCQVPLDRLQLVQQERAGGQLLGLWLAKAELMLHHVHQELQPAVARSVEVYRLEDRLRVPSVSESARAQQHAALQAGCCSGSAQ